MGDHHVWSLSLGRWGHTHVRVHMLFLLFAVFTLYLSWLTAVAAPEAGMMWVGAASLAILFVSVFLHEIAHLITATYLGGRHPDMVLGPLGGLVPPRVSANPQMVLLTTAAGPSMNLLICLAAAPLIAIVGGQPVAGLLHPFAPNDLTIGPAWLVALKLTLWINWIVLLANLLPAYPFDGARAVRAVIALASPDANPQRTRHAVSQIGMLMALGLLIVAWLVRELDAGSLAPPWFALSLLAVFVFFGAKHERNRSEPWESEELGDFDLDETGELPAYEPTFAEDAAPLPPLEEDTDLGAYTQWMEDRREANRRRQEDLEAEEEHRVDEILKRLHQSGMEGLSLEDRALLRRASERYRNRLRK